MTARQPGRYPMTDRETGSVREELAELYRRWFAAIPAHDEEFFAGVLADDWHYTNVSGEVRGKREYLRYIAPLPSDVPPNRMIEMVVRRFDPVVLVHGRYAVPARLAPPGAPDTLFTAVWLRRDDRWIALAHHATNAPGAP